ncbi:hypothetical protein B0T10DRAFT_606890 [Thelonectria olida]|uniref:Uncharacterized protein n=1 Tax=Thelonectria olida TaxID=1576542 RepID=A0A9P8W3J2_9HYPO|nr:hypothetical protein B0T10DRAFT_606890 [Thelonectria olida]
MATGVVEVLGVIGTLLGIVQFGMDNFESPETAKSILKVGVGLDYDGGLTNAGGDLPDVRLFNEGGDFLGMTVDPGKVKSGSGGVVEVPHDSDNGQQATYALLSANTDAICVAYVTITWPDGNEYGWVGDWGQQCGATWYYSHLYVSGTQAQPKCMWIDKNGDQPQTGFQLHFPEWVTEQPGVLPEGKDINYFCNAGPPFKIRTDKDPNDITYWVLNKRDEDNNKRSDTAQSYGPTKGPTFPRRHLNARNQTMSMNARFVEQLVMDNSTEHVTAELCESENSAGPDFVNLADGQFCRMSDKTLWPICDNDTTDGCFDLEEQQLVINGVVQRTKKYNKVMTWGR